MKTILYFLITISTLLSSCNNSGLTESGLSVDEETIINKDKRFKSKGHNITCENIFLTVNDEKTEKSTFMYGEVFVINFEDIKGFIKVDGNISPEMSIYNISSEGDTVFQAENMYKDFAKGEFNTSPLILQTSIIVGHPIHSHNSYTLHVKIFDNNSEAYYNTIFKYDVVPDKKIDVTKTDNVSYNELYLFSLDRKKASANHKFKVNEAVKLTFENLLGFKITDNQAHIGMSIFVVDNKNDTIINYSDLFLETKIVRNDIEGNFGPFFSVDKKDISNPLVCTTTIWDKDTDAKITSKFSFTIE